MLDARFIVAICILLLVAVGSATLALTIRAKLKRMKMQKRFRRGRQGEQRAEGLLQKHGFQVIEDQLQQTTGLWIDDQWREVTVRADFLARRDGSTFVVEVKTGGKAPDPSATATRRQLFEYHHVYRADGLILADMEAGRLYQIRFPNARRTSHDFARRFGWPAVIAGSLVGLVAVGLLAAGLLR